jgi:cytochrome d ubiquinol oxidase subunit I
VGISFVVYLILYATLLFAYVRTLFVMARKAVLVDRPNEMETLQEKLLAAKPAEEAKV